MSKTSKLWIGANPTDTPDRSTTPTLELQNVKVNRRDLSKDRYISKAIQHQIWKRDLCRCSTCGSQRNLNMDHVKPIALGGDSKLENLRLLCFNCNQRQAIKVFGVDYIQRKQAVSQGQLSFSG